MWCRPRFRRTREPERSVISTVQQHPSGRRPPPSGCWLASAGVALPDAQPYGEAWLLHDSATVAAGPLAGRSLGELLPQYGHALAGPEVDMAAGWPLLAKLLISLT